MLVPKPIFKKDGPKQDLNPISLIFDVQISQILNHRLLYKKLVLDMLA